MATADDDFWKRVDAIAAHLPEEVLRHPPGVRGLVALILAVMEKEKVDAPADDSGWLRG